jgi:hypothetical protein
MNEAARNWMRSLRRHERDRQDADRASRLDWIEEELAGLVDEETRQVTDPDRVYLLLSALRYASVPRILDVPVVKQDESVRSARDLNRDELWFRRRERMEKRALAREFLMRSW